MAKTPVIKVRLKVAGFVDQKMITSEFDLEVPEGTRLKKFFQLADKSGKLPGKPIKKILGLPRQPTVLLNGEGLDLPEGMDQPVKAGDEVSLITPFGGG